MSQLPGAEKYANWSKHDLIAKLLNYENRQQVKVNENPITNPEFEPAITQNTLCENIVASIKPRKKNPRPFDMSKYSKRRIALRIAYFGWNYHGFETNANEKSYPTIEGQLYTAFVGARLISDLKECNFTKCGRTDKGVSGLGQVIALNVRSNLPHDSPLVLPSISQVDGESSNRQVAEGVEESKKNIDGKTRNTKDTEEIPYIEVLNRMLPNDIRVIAWANVNPDFNARFDCRHRHYKYFFVKGNLDIDLMRNAANRFLGTHDFRNFCKIDPSKKITNFKRTVTRVGIDKVQSPSITNHHSASKEFYEFNLHATAFLWHQVRCMVAILFLVGQGLEDPSVIDDLLDIEKTPAKPNYEMANELPLVLYDCQYDDVKWQYCRDNDHTFNTPSKIYKHIYEQWNIHMTKTLLMSTLLNDFGGMPLKQFEPIYQETTQDKNDELADNSNETLDEFVFSDITGEEPSSGKHTNFVTGGKRKRSKEQNNDGKMSQMPTEGDDDFYDPMNMDDYEDQLDNTAGPSFNSQSSYNIREGGHFNSGDRHLGSGGYEEGFFSGPHHHKGGHHHRQNQQGDKTVDQDFFNDFPDDFDDDDLK
ncbi:12915_t:CDS:2 [Acaulospora morrowiae]|uniref:12915_t:CDS:1 n=1 Tax=Acaulospora morrowiae TaxID=94023 RepID=A0A9N8W618_9GLOM|nr:12915_t:CDS:2 [Acaulospora morrowiae]